MVVEDILLTSSQTAQQYSACLWDYNTKNVLKFYKNGGVVSPKALEVVGQSYILSSEATKPLLHVWPLNSQEIDKSIKLILPGPATCLAVCPRNTYLAVAIDTRLYIWLIASGKLLSVQQRHYQPITCLKFSSDSVYVVVSGEDGILVVYFLADLIAIHNNLFSGQVEPKYTKNDHTMPIRDVHIGVFGRHSRVATCSVDQTGCLYNLSTGELLLRLVFTESLTSIVFDSPCWKLYIGTNKGLIKYYNLKNPARNLTHHAEKTIENEFMGHKEKIVALALNSKNTVLASGSQDNFVYTWDILSRQILQTIEHKAPITNLRFLPKYSNFFEQVLKPEIIFKPLQRSLNLDSEEWTVSNVQTEDIEFSDDETCVEKETSRKRLEEENIRLRIINSQLYRAALNISKKYNNVNETQ